MASSPGFKTIPVSSFSLSSSVNSKPRGVSLGMTGMNPLQASHDDEPYQSKSLANTDNPSLSKANGGVIGSEGRSISTSSSSSKLRSIETVLEEIPIGMFHWRLLFLCGISFCADAMEVTLLAFMSTCAGVEWDLTDGQMASITSAVFLGQFVGGLFWGTFADIYGRRKSFLLTITIISGAGILSGFSPNYVFLLLMRGIVGFGVGGLTVPFDLLAEFIPAEVRGEYLMKMEYFWTMGSLFVAGMAWICLTQYGWRTLTFISAVPVCIASIISYYFLPESPRWLLETGRTKEAEKILKEAIIFNGAVHLEDALDFTLMPHSTSTSSEETVEDGGIVVVEDVPAQQMNGICQLFSTQYKLYQNLLKPENISYSLPLWASWFAFGFAYYGVILFVSRLYNSGSDLSHLVCDFNFPPIFYNAASEGVGLLISIQVIDTWGRPKLMLIAYTLAAVTALLMGIETTATGILVVGCLARASAMSANCTTWVITPELYKTDVRATGHASCNAFTRIGGFLVPFVVQSKLTNLTVGVILACVNIIGITMSFVLPNMKGRDIDDPDRDMVTGERIVDQSVYFLFNGAPRAFLQKLLGKTCIKQV